MSTSIFRRLSIGVIGAALISLVATTAAHAQRYPSKPVHFVVAFTSGSATDIIARAVGDAVVRGLGQPIVVDNKPGAGGTIAAGLVAKAKPDGYSLLVHSAGHAVNPMLYANLPYDTAKDFIAVATLAALPNVLVVPPGRYKSLQQLVAAAKASPGKLNYGSAGIGSETHMNAEKFRASAGFDAVHVPFKGSPEALSEVMAGRLDFFFAPIEAALQLIKEGKVVALAVGTPRRAALLPDLPTTTELGYPGSDSTFWIGLFAPAKTPSEVVVRVNQEVNAALQLPQIRERFAVLGAEPLSMTSDELEAYVKREIEQNGRLARAAGLKAN